MAPRGASRQIADELRRLMACGELRPGDMAPSELALAQRHSVSRGTARTALTILVGEDLLTVERGLGRRAVGGASGRLPSTKWGRIAKALQEQLDSGEYVADVAMPSEAVLAAQFGVSRNTVRRAYKHLVEVGSVVVRHGIGAFPALR